MGRLEPWAGCLDGHGCSEFAYRMALVLGRPNLVHRRSGGPRFLPSGQHSIGLLDFSAKQLLDLVGSELCLRNQPFGIDDRGRTNPGQCGGSLSREHIVLNHWVVPKEILWD